ncbi:meiosis regulator and mRNA stability factor 1 isoform X2 [Lepeophtheirus salmonis]|uniref:meiosis regulator and mRNA stability factor 1 isoform X2 n=1 Tax=Lepeophtheirus salmonis TaxID=72036 RepID=UPI001AEB9510|nr:meiosis regulator and mRNA stability factor 1-like isoform X2 [Lepeophtheirus salmonis]
MDKSDGKLMWGPLSRKSSNIGRLSTSDVPCSMWNSKICDRATYIPYPNISSQSISELKASKSYYQSISPSLIELQVTNLDQTIDQREMKIILTSMFRDHVDVTQVSVFFQSDGNMAACVKVPTLHDAQIAISRLHRKKVGYKRIVISYSYSHGHNLNVIKSKVVSLLSEVPTRKLQLFKFREMFEKRYHNSIGVSDLYKMKDFIVVSDEDNGRMVSLINPGIEYKDCISSYIFSAFPQSNIPTSELDPAFCSKHSSKVISKGWAEKENETQLPLINIRLSLLSKNMRVLLKSHGGSVPLASIVQCYNADYELEIDVDNGVPMEHLLSCIKEISIHYGVSGVKKVTLMKSFNTEYSCSHLNNISYNGLTTPPAPLAGQLSLFSRELVDLLKISPGCRMPFHKFIPTYHHHFGRQCRVADYGYTKLKDLFEALPNVVQILGEGSRAIITLSHRSQVKRFISDILRILKNQTSKQFLVDEIKSLYEGEFGQLFKISNYGVCHVEDLLGEIPDTSIVVTGSSKDKIISIPKREQTSDEIERTIQFSMECVELLRHAPDCCLLFNKFIPAYHHHFGRQCRVADYGFTKLIELFEAIPHIVEITEDCDGERLLQLSGSERLAVIGEQIAEMIRSSHKQYLSLNEISESYMIQYGYQLRPENYGEKTIRNLLNKFVDFLCVEDTGSELKIFLSDRSYIRTMAAQVVSILTNKDGKMLLKDFFKEYKDIFNTHLNFENLKNDLSNWIEVCEENNEQNYICLKSEHLCLINVQNLLKENNGRVLLSDLEVLYSDKYKKSLDPATYGFSSIYSLLQAFGDSISLRGKGMRKTLVLINDLSFSDRFCSGIITNSKSSCFNEEPHQQSKSAKKGKSEYLPPSSFPPRESLQIYNSSFDSEHSNFKNCYSSTERLKYQAKSYQTSLQCQNYDSFSEFSPLDIYQSNQYNHTDSSSIRSSSIFDIHSPIGKQRILMKSVSSYNGTSPRRFSNGDSSYNCGFNIQNSSALGHKKSPGSLCESNSPTTSSLYTDEDSSLASQFNQSSKRLLSPDVILGGHLIKNNSAPSMLTLASKYPSFFS